MPEVDQAQLVFNPEKLWILNAVIGFILFGIATDLKISDFRAVLQSPRAALIGLAVQFLFIPAFSFLLTLALRPAPSVTLGMILVAACPAGNLSNFLTYLARGNTALSVGLTLVSTATAVVMTPLNFTLWARLHPDAAAIFQRVHVDPLDIFFTIFIMLGIPLIAGIAFAWQFPRAAARLHAPFKFLSIAFFLAVVGAILMQNAGVFRQYIGWVAAAVMVQDAAALAAGFFAARAAGVCEADVRAITIESGIKNSALALGLVFTFFGGLGGMALVAGFWGIWHIVAGLALALYWSRRPPDSMNKEFA